jgi:hypothetical protein
MPLLFPKITSKNNLKKYSLFDGVVCITSQASGTPANDSDQPHKLKD